MGEDQRAHVRRAAATAAAAAAAAADGAARPTARAADRRVAPAVRRWGGAVREPSSAASESHQTHRISSWGWSARATEIAPEVEASAVERWACERGVALHHFLEEGQEFLLRRVEGYPVLNFGLG